MTHLPFQSPLTDMVRRGVLMIGLLGSVLVAFVVTPVSGAWYFDSRQGSLTTTTTSFSMALTDEGGVDVQTLDLRFDDMRPGDAQTRSFTVRNAGTVAGDIRIMADGMQGANVVASSLSMFSYTIPGYGLLEPLTGGTVQLGTLQPGESRTYQVVNTLGDGVGNDWQGKTVTSDLRLSMEQTH